ncbi:hypothetical protein RI367_001927 [Sorochytrium milnesiophthora]
MHPLLSTLLIDAGIQGLTWLVSAPLKTEKLYDFSGAVTYAACVLNVLLDRDQSAGAVGTLHPRQILAATGTLVWCTRLGGFLFARVLRHGKDARFDGIKAHPLKLLGAFAAQVVWVYVTALPVYITVSNAAADQRSFNAADGIGIAVWLLGFGIEVLADRQKNTFKTQHPDDFVTGGLWAYSRHPNYFGEVTLWTGMFVLCAPGFSQPWQWVSLVSPLFVFALLYFGSGVRLAEQGADRRYGQRADYRLYKARTSIFLPLPPRLVGQESVMEDDIQS